MELKEHKNLTIEKWRQFPFYKQILMIGTEFQRASSWIEKKDFREVNLCHERALELVFLTILYLAESQRYSNSNWEKNRLKELLRFKECLQQEYINKEKSFLTNKKLFSTLILFSRESFSLLGSGNN